DSPIDESSRLLFLSMGIVRHFANDSIASSPSLLVKHFALHPHRALQYQSQLQEGSSSSPFVHSFGGQTHPYRPDYATLRLRIIQHGLQTKVKRNKKNRITHHHRPEYTILFHCNGNSHTQ